jgi:hypothetical protein
MTQGDTIGDLVYAADVVVAVRAGKFFVVKDREGVKREVSNPEVLHLMRQGRMVLIVDAAQVSDMMPSQASTPKEECDNDFSSSAKW